MIKVILPLIKKINSPGLIIHSRSDLTSREENVKIITERISKNKIETYYVDNAHHNMFDKNIDQEKIFKKILDFLNSH